MINKVIYGNTTLLDLTADTVTAEHLETGYTAHNANGEAITGSIVNRGSVNAAISTLQEYHIPAGLHDGNGTIQIDSSEAAKIIPENIKSGVSILGVQGAYMGGSSDDATATASDILFGKTAYLSSGKATGTMQDNGAVAGVIDTLSGEYSIQQGYHNGSGSVKINETEQAKLIASNIKNGVTILGVTGTYTLFTQISPVAADFKDGYVSLSVAGWTVQANSNNRADVYQVEAGHTYFCRLGDTVKTRWRGVFTATSPVGATENITGSYVIYQNEDNVPQRACFAYKPRQNGYISIVKTRDGTNGIPTFMFDITGFEALLGGE